MNALTKVCILTTVHIPFDTRIFHKEAKSMIKVGYKVTLIAQHSKNEVVGGVKIIVLPKPRTRFMRIFGLSWRALYLALSQNADVYHFHDPELILAGIVLRIFGKKVIYDVHEDVPKQIMNKNWLGDNQIKKVAAFIVNIVEQIGGLLFNKIVVATPDIAKRFPENKTVILRNFPILELIDNTVSISYKKNKPVIIYAGGLTKIRGIKEIIQAMEYIGDKAELWLLGKWESEKFERECKELKGWKYTRYFGFKKLNKVYDLMRRADIGLHIVYTIERHIIGLPVKVFEYMACSLPVIISDSPYWKKIFGECALFANSYDSKDIAKKILYLLDKPNEAKELGKKGRKLIEKKFNWEVESEKLLEMYNNL